MPKFNSFKISRFGRLVLAGLLPALLILIAVSGFVQAEAQKRSRLSGEIRTERSTVNALAQLRIDLLSAETGQRGYILTGDATYLQPYAQGTRNASQDYAALDRLYGGPGTMAGLHSLSDKKFAELAESIATFRSGGFSAAQRIVTTGIGKGFMDQMQMELDVLQKSQEGALTANLAQSTKVTNLANEATLAGSLLSVLIISVVILLIKRILDQQTVLTVQAEAQYRSELRAKERLERAEANDEALLSSIGDGLLVSDAKGSVLRTNSVFEEMIGLSNEQIKKLNLLELTWHDQKDQPLPSSEMPISVALKRGVRTTGSYLMRHADGVRFPVAVTVSPVMHGKEFVGTISIVRDISQEVEVDRAKTEFVSLASHQLRTPLSAINWYTEMLLNGDAGSVSTEQRNFLDQVYASSQRMVELVNSLLNVSRLELGTFSVEPETTDITVIADSVLSELKPHITQASLAVETEYASGLPSVLLDQKLVRVVLQNILSNAVKYTQAGGRIRMAISDEAGDAHLSVPHLLVTVSDNGYGIPRAQHGQIFSKLFRADNVTDKDTEGTGLGLYITKSVMEQTGGSISFVSKEGKGTTFFIAIPRSGMSKRDGNKGLS